MCVCGVSVHVTNCSFALQVTFSSFSTKCYNSGSQYAQPSPCTRARLVEYLSTDPPLPSRGHLPQAQAVCQQLLRRHPVHVFPRRLCLHRHPQNPCRRRSRLYQGRPRLRRLGKMSAPRCAQAWGNPVPRLGWLPDLRWRCKGRVGSQPLRRTEAKTTMHASECAGESWGARVKNHAVVLQRARAQLRGAEATHVDAGTARRGKPVHTHAWTSHNAARRTHITLNRADARGRRHHALGSARRSAAALLERGQDCDKNSKFEEVEPGTTKRQTKPLRAGDAETLIRAQPARRR